MNKRGATTKKPRNREKMLNPKLSQRKTKIKIKKFAIKENFAVSWFLAVSMYRVLIYALIFLGFIYFHYSNMEVIPIDNNIIEVIPFHY